MNLYLAIIVGALISIELINSLARVLNLRTMATKLPTEFEGYYDADTYKKSQDYNRVNTRFALLNSTLSFVATLSFILLGGFNWLDVLVRYGVVAWAPVYYMQVGGFDLKSMSLVTFAYPLGIMLGPLCGGFISDRLFMSNRSRVIMLAGVLSGLAIVGSFLGLCLVHSHAAARPMACEAELDRGRALGEPATPGPRTSERP